MEPKGTVVDRIRALANAHGDSLTTLEVKLGFGNGTISRWNQSSAGSDKLTKIADHFNVSIDFLLGREQKETPLINEDQELTEYLEMLKTRPECRMLFQLSKNATKEDVEAAVRIIEALRNK